jgi:hypothetical protein
MLLMIFTPGREYRNSNKCVDNWNSKKFRVEELFEVTQ